MIALCGASLLATQPTYTFSFGVLLNSVTTVFSGASAVFNRVTAAWSALPKRVILIGVLCFGVWKLVNKLCAVPIPKALPGVKCSICQDTQEGTWATCKEIYGDTGSDKHGFHRNCIFDKNDKLKEICKKCSLCRATKNSAALETSPAPINWWDGPFSSFYC